MGRRGSRRPGLNFKIPILQAVFPFDVRTQVKPETFAKLLTKDLQEIQATATVKYALRPTEAGRVFSTIAYKNSEVYPRIINSSFTLKLLKIS